MDGSHPLFTDYQFEALGVPRNPEILANASNNYFDMGLCGPLRTDQSTEKKYCGLFKTPTLRNVAKRSVFFPNGRFHSLKEALRFYVQRDTDPKLWYPVFASGSVDKFDDLPASLRGNIDVIDGEGHRSWSLTSGFVEEAVDSLGSLEEHIFVHVESTIFEVII